MIWLQELWRRGCFQSHRLLQFPVGNSLRGELLTWPLSCVRLLAIPWTAVHQGPLFSTISQSLLRLMSTDSVMLSNHLILCHPFSFCFSSFPASGSFPVSCLFTSGGQSIRASASATVLPLNIKGWFPLRLTGWISLQSKGLSGVFCSTTVWKHQFSGAQPSSRSSSHIHVWLQKQCLCSGALVVSNSLWPHGL